jgi:hypothetical protein
MARVGIGEYEYKPARDFFGMPPGELLGTVTRVRADALDLPAHWAGVDARGDIYARLTVDRSVDKFVRIR